MKEQVITQNQINSEIHRILLFNGRYNYQPYQMVDIVEFILFDFNWLEMDEDKILDQIYENIDSYLIYDDDIWQVVHCYTRPVGTINILQILDEFADDLFYIITCLRKGTFRLP